MKNFIDFWAAPDWQLLGLIALILLVTVGSIYWWSKVVAKNKEKEQKKNAVTIDAKYLNSLFKVKEVEKDKSIGLLSPDPTREYSSGTGRPFWAKLDNVSDDLKVEGKVLRVTNEGSGGTIKIVSVRYEMLPTEKETFLLREARTKALIN